MMTSNKVGSQGGKRFSSPSSVLSADKVLLLRPSEESKKDHFVAFSIKSPKFFSGNYELTFAANMNFEGNIYVISIQEPDKASQILKIVGNRDKRYDVHSAAHIFNSHSSKGGTTMQ